VSPPDQDGELTFADLRDSFLEHLARERNLSPQTVRAYAVDLVELGAFLEEHGRGALEADTPLLRAYLGRLRRRQLSRATLARRMASLRTFYRWLVERGLLPGSPAAALRAPRRERTLPRFLDRETATRLVTAPASGTSALAPRDHAILETLYSTGARVTELVGMSIGDLDLGSGTVRVRGKGNRERLTVLGEPAVAAIRTYLAILGGCKKDVTSPDQPVFRNRRGTRLSDRSVRRILQQWRRQLGLPEDVTPHTLRHTFATHMLAAGASLRDVQELLGHSSVASTQIYTHVTYEHLQQVYDRTHPRAV
jgi:integrase/recombinase XerC